MACIFSTHTLHGKHITRIGNTDITNMHTLSGHETGGNTLWLGLVGGIAQIEFKDNNLEQGCLTLFTHVDKPGITSPADIGQLTDQRTKDGSYQLGGIYCIAQDSCKRIWACTSEPSLLRFNSQRKCFSSVSKNMGIDGDNVHSITIDGAGQFWLTTNFGILQLNIDADDKISCRKLYTHKDGLPTDYYGSTLSSRFSDGTVCFINQNYFISMPNKKMTRQIQDYLVHITDIQVDGISLHANNEHANKKIRKAKHISLTYQQNNLTIFLSALAYGNEHTLRYAYELTGIDNGFRYTQNGQNSICYSQLPPGTYTLRYGVADPSLQQPIHTQEITIYIQQPLWWRWWAKLTYAAIVLIIATLIVHSIRERSRKKNQLMILKLEKQNLDKQYQRMTMFYTQVIHDFMTPVTLMSELTHQLQQQVRPALQATVFMLASQTDKLLESIYNIRDVKDDASIKDAMAQAREMTKTDLDFLRKCTESVNSHISDEGYSHQVMMEEVGASHSTLYRKLKALTGMDATSFIRSMRMKAACQILSEEPYHTHK